jgi:hypothetical protein
MSNIGLARHRTSSVSAASGPVMFRWTDAVCGASFLSCEVANSIGSAFEKLVETSKPSRFCVSCGYTAALSGMDFGSR